MLSDRWENYYNYDRLVIACMGLMLCQRIQYFAILRSECTIDQLGSRRHTRDALTAKSNIYISDK